MAVKAAQAKEGPKMVRIRLFKDAGAYSRPVFVGVNGQRYMIERGVEVDVPEYVAEVLENAENQDAKTALRISDLSQRYQEKVAQL